MKRVLKCRYLGIFLALSLILAMVPSFSTQAGLNHIIIDETSIREEIDEAVWSNPDSDVTGKDGVISFPKESSDATRLITRQMVEFSAYTECLLEAEFTLNFTNLPEGETFIFAIGLQTMESMAGETGNIELTFSNKGGLYAGVNTFNEDGEVVTVASPMACGNAKKSVTVEVKYFSNNNLKITVGNKKVCDTKLTDEISGHVGFLQSGSCEVQVSNLKMQISKYDRPENSNFEENFEKNIFNANLLFSELIQGGRLEVQEYNGSNVLMFEGTEIAYIGTRQMYSNFEISFDVVYSQNQPVLDENGEVIIPRSRGFGVSFGGDTFNMDGQQYTRAADLIVFEGNVAYSHNTVEKWRGIPTTHLYNAPESDRPYNIRVSVIDKVVTVGVRWLDETEYEDFLTYNLKETATGYIHIWSPSGYKSYFAIDNLKVVNKDEGANLVETEFKSAELYIPEDFKYVPQGLVYRTENNTDKKSDVWYYPILIVAGACLVSLGAVMSITTIRRKRGKRDEK